MKKIKLLPLVALPVIGGSLLPLVSYGANNTTKNTSIGQRIVDEDLFKIRVEYDTKLVEFIDLRSWYTRRENAPIHFRYKKCITDEKNVVYDNHFNRKESDILIGNTSIKDNRYGVVITAPEDSDGDWVNCKIFIRQEMISLDIIWREIKFNNGIDIKIVIDSCKRMPNVVEPTTR